MSETAQPPYQFSRRWQRRRPPVVRDCEFDKLPCQFCPQGCKYGKKLKLLEIKAHGALPLNFRKMLFDAIRNEFLSRRPKP